MSFFKNSVIVRPLPLAIPNYRLVEIYLHFKADAAIKTSNYPEHLGICCSNRFLFSSSG